MYALAAVLAATHSSVSDNALDIAIWLTLIAAYWTPTAVAWIRHVPNVGSVTVINGLLGWSVIGWIVALAMACRSKHPQQIAVVPYAPVAGPPR
jgi:Superinfection immunity protein